MNESTAVVILYTCVYTHGHSTLFWYVYYTFSLKQSSIKNNKKVIKMLKNTSRMSQLKSGFNGCEIQHPWHFVPNLYLSWIMKDSK